MSVYFKLDDWGSIPGRGKIFLYSTAARLALEPTPLLSNGYRWRFPSGVKWPECEVDHSPPSSAEVRNCGVIRPVPPSVFMAWYLIN
jgi:hypothetical protein